MEKIKISFFLFLERWKIFFLGKSKYRIIKQYKISWGHMEDVEYVAQIRSWGLWDTVCTFTTKRTAEEFLKNYIETEEIAKEKNKRQKIKEIEYYTWKNN